MGILEAKRYIEELHKRQNDPFLWPDFLTGLPDKSAIIRKLEEIFPKLGKYAIAYTRIANIHPYLIKYGPDNHADIIQWTAAILKTTCGKCGSCFVGTLSTHDFVTVCEAKNMRSYLKEAGRLFKKRVEKFYTGEDLKNKTTLSFNAKGEQITIGLLKLVSVMTEKKPRGGKSMLIQDMARASEELEKTDEDIIIFER